MTYEGYREFITLAKEEKLLNLFVQRKHKVSNSGHVLSFSLFYLCPLYPLIYFTIYYHCFASLSSKRIERQQLEIISLFKTHLFENFSTFCCEKIAL